MKITRWRIIGLCCVFVLFFSVCVVGGGFARVGVVSSNSTSASSSVESTLESFFSTIASTLASLVEAPAPLSEGSSTTIVDESAAVQGKPLVLLRDEVVYVGTQLVVDQKAVPVYVLNSSVCKAECRFRVYVPGDSGVDGLVPLELDSSLRDFSVWGYVNVSVNKTLYNDVESSVECGSGWVDDGHAYRCGEDVRICERVEGNRCFWMQGTPAGYETEYRMVLREIVNKTLAVDPHKGVEAEIRFRPAAESGKFDVYVQSNHILGEIDPYWTTDPSGGNWYAVGKDKERSGSVDYNLGDLASQGTLASAVASGNNYGGDSLVSSLYYASGSIEVEAWDLVSGSSSWTNTIKGSNSVMGGMYDGDGGFWYQTWSNGKFNITKIDATDGSIICSNQSDDSYSYFSPLVTDNDIVIAYSGSGKIYGVKKGDCGHAYTIACTLALYGYCAYDGNSVYCPCSQGTIQFDPSDGTVNASWSGAPATSPGIALDDDYVYVGDGDSILFLDIKDGSTEACLLYTSPSPRDGLLSRMPSSA